MNYKFMFEYYNKQDIFPTYGRFKTVNDLNSYEKQRRDIFINKLSLLPQLFQNAKLIEFGPDTGENSLVFAKWGALCKLVEPNKKPHQIIKEYFNKFKLSDRLIDIVSSDINLFSSREKYDFIDAEGFIYTIKPESMWINLFYKLLKDDGFIILFYCEKYGNFFELMLKVIYSRVCILSKMDSVDVAQMLFITKWNSISHKRSMEAWIIDVLQNPFVRIKYFFELNEFLKKMHDVGFNLYSSWPMYRDSMNIYWFKKNIDPEEQLKFLQEFIDKSKLSFMFGRKHFIMKSDTALNAMVLNLLNATDELIDNFDDDKVQEVIEYLSGLAEFVNSNSNNIISTTSNTQKTLASIYSIRHILKLLMQGNINEIINFCNSNQAFITTWGTPSHFAVFRKISG